MTIPAQPSFREDEVEKAFEGAYNVTSGVAYSDEKGGGNIRDGSKVVFLGHAIHIARKLLAKQREAMVAAVEKALPKQNTGYLILEGTAKENRKKKKARTYGKGWDDARAAALLALRDAK